jgi:hypothetical protein
VSQWYPLTDVSPLPLTGESATPDPRVRQPLTGESPKQGIEQEKEQGISATANAVDGFAVADEVAGKKCGEGYKTKRGRVLAGEQLAWFEEYWGVFDLRKGKADAADAWLDLRVDREVKDRIIAGALREAKTRTKPGERGPAPKWAQGWLSGRRWEDEPLAGANGVNGHESDWLSEVGL